MSDRLNDRELMARFVERRDREAFEALVRRWDRRVLAHLIKSCGDPDSAEDLRQEVFTRVYRYGKSYNPNYAFSTWLFRIVSNQLKTWSRAQGRRLEAKPGNGNPDGGFPEPADPAPGPRERAAKAQENHRLHRAIGGLDAEDRELLLLRFEREFTYRRIGEITGAPETTVKSRLYKALERLRRELKKRQQ